MAGSTSRFRKIEVLFFHPYFRDGGVEKTNIRISKIFLKWGIKVSFVSLEFKSPFMDEIEKLGIELIRLNSSRTIFSLPGLIRLIKNKAKLNNNLIVIGCQNFANLILLTAKLFIKDNNVKWIVTERNHLIELSFGIKRRIIKILMKFLYKYATLVIVNSERTANDLENYIGQSVLCIYNPILDENNKFDFYKKIRKLKRNGKPVIIGIGRLTRQKDFITLIKAFSLVKKEIDAKLIILGEGEERQNLINLINELGLSKDVEMPGFVKNPLEYVTKADVFVLSSIYEGLPNALIEAIAVGTPVISTNCPSGPSEILLNGKGGELVEVGDYQSMAKAIIKYIKNPNYALKKWRIAYKNLYRFSVKEIKKKWKRVFSEIGVEI